MGSKVKVMSLVLCMVMCLWGCGKSVGKTGFNVKPPELKNDKSVVQTDPPSSEKDEKVDVNSAQSAASEIADVPRQSPLSEESESPPASSESKDSYPEGNTEVLEIGEKMFLTQINDMYFNFDAYKDKTIIVEGMYQLLYSWDGSKTAPAVYRRGPGCCGNDGWGGFLLKFDGDFPAENEWIRVTGKLELETEGNYTNMYLKVISLEVKQERGAEFVMQ